MNDYEALGIGAGIVAAIWLFFYSGVIRTILDVLTRIFGFLAELVVPKKEMTDPAADLILTYLKDTCPRSIVGGTERFVRERTWVKPLNSQMEVIFRSLSEGDRLYFYKGWIPIFASRETFKGENRVAPAIRYIRGTLNLTGFIAEASKYYRENKESGLWRRFNTMRYYGSRSERQNSPSNPGSQPEIYNTTGREPVGWSEDEIGHPVVTEKEVDILSIPPELGDFIKDIEFWAKHKPWYADRTVPWRRGYLLHGLPGTGKTSIVRAIGESLDLPICIPDLTSMDNQDLIKTWANMVSRAPCIILLEDLDSIFDGRQSKVDGLSYDALLNCIDGIEKNDGVVTIITTNHLEKMDPALASAESKNASRPGRIDKVIRLPNSLSHIGRTKVATRILKDAELVAMVLNNHAGLDVTPAQFQEVCIQEALKHLWK